MKSTRAPDATTAGTSDEDRLLTTPELAERLGVSISTVRRLVRDGTIPVLRVRRAVRFRFGAVVEALAVEARP